MKLLRRTQESTVALARRLGARAYLILAALFSVIVIGDFGVHRLMAAAETRLFDLLVANRINMPVADPDIVIIDIDEASLAAMAPEHGRWPWPNQVIGELVTGIEAQGPRAIVLDILFSDPDTLRPASDAAFNAAIARSTTSFFPMLRLAPQNDRLSRIPVGALPGARPIDGVERDPDATIAMILPKVPAALDNGRLGTHQVTPDRDGVIRRYPAWLEHAGWRIPSLPQRVAEELGYPGGHPGMGVGDTPDAAGRQPLLNWRGPPFSYHYLSFAEVYRALRPSAKPTLPPTTFKGKIVVIGSTAPSLFDVKGTPMARIHPGVEILATAIDNFKHGDSLRERPRWVMVIAALTLIWGMAVALFRQMRIEVFDTAFAALQGGLILFAYIVVNFSNWYIDTSAPLSLGLMYFAVARLYYGFSLKSLASSQLNALDALPEGRRLLAVLAIRLADSSPAEQRRLKGEIDLLVTRCTLTAGRIARMIEDPGFVQHAFADHMLVYWLSEDENANWAADADAIEARLKALRPKQGWPQRLHFARSASLLCWNRAHGWKAGAFRIILAALEATTEALVLTGQTDSEAHAASPAPRLASPATPSMESSAAEPPAGIRS